ncbi:MAG TPA: GNAT family N-acetyltransferase [Rubrobacteraceae bacterium]|nr:GNAT family N-acetyltransferase [Rubrobacteraceae bacterium]
MPELAIRAALEEDAPLILQLIKELAEYEKLSHEVVATEDSLRRALFGQRRFAEALIGEVEGEPAGFALFFHNFSTFLGRPGIYLEDLYVRPEFRGSGLGRALLAYLARLALERGCGRLEWSVLDWNEPAIGFYKSVGAAPVDGWTGYRVAGKALAELGEEA